MKDRSLDMFGSTPFMEKLDLRLVDDRANKDVDLASPTPQHVTVRLLNETGKDLKVKVGQVRTNGEPIVMDLTAMNGCICSHSMVFGVLPVSAIAVEVTDGDTSVLTREYAVNWRGQRCP